MQQELTEKYGISLLYKELPNSIYGMYTNVRNQNYIVVNKNIHTHFQKFCTIALIYYFHNKTPNILTEFYSQHEQQLKAIEYAKEYLISTR